MSNYNNLVDRYVDNYVPTADVDDRWERKVDHVFVAAIAAVDDPELGGAMAVIAREHQQLCELHRKLGVVHDTVHMMVKAAANDDQDVGRRDALRWVDDQLTRISDEAFNL